MPWHTTGKFAFSPINVTSHKPYRGVNTLCCGRPLNRRAMNAGNGAHTTNGRTAARKCARGKRLPPVVFWKFANGSAETQEDGEEHTVSGSRLLFTRGYSVFNASQVDGYAPKADGTAPIEDRIERADAFFQAINARVAHQGNRAFYSPADDSITLPPFASFFTPVDYYSTRAHETDTGHPRPADCNRELGKRFGDQAYSVEELIAELTAAFGLRAPRVKQRTAAGSFAIHRLMAEGSEGG